MQFKFELMGDVDPQEVKEFIEQKYLSTLRIKDIINSFWDELLLEFLDYPIDYSEEFISNQEFDNIYLDFIYKDFSKQDIDFLNKSVFVINPYTAEDIQDAIRVGVNELIDSYVNDHLKEDEDLSLRIMQLKMGIKDESNNSFT